MIRAALLAGIVLVPAAALAACPSPPGLTVLVPPLERSAGRLEAGLPLSIVAFGSSSTAGNGASSPEASYPARLGAELNTRLPGAEIAVLNRGRGGEDAPEEFARLGRDVVAARPDLVIWQFGTNAVLRRDDLSGDGELVRRGVAELKAAGIDVVLMDLQYAPRVLDRPAERGQPRRRPPRGRGLRRPAPRLGGGDGQERPRRPGPARGHRRQGA